MLSCGSKSYQYDSANRLVKADLQTYTYNAEDVRIRNFGIDEDTTYTYNTNCKLSQLLTKTTNGIVTKYIYGLGLIGEECRDSFMTYHFDYRGSTVALTDICGNITDTFKYDTYGYLTEHIGINLVLFGYNGRDGVVTDSNGLLYMRARYYSPKMRRFINADIIPGNISNAITLNRYAYANGNPVSNIDPFGLSAEERGGSGQYESFDLDGDGEYDYYMYTYNYTYTDGILWWKKEHIGQGKVYFYVNVDVEFFNDSKNHPENFNKKTDLMIGDFTNDRNSTLYAYHANNISKQYRDEIIKIMKQYDDDFNTPWFRTEDSLMVEWEGHHKYRIAESAKNINFDNEEEGMDAKYYDDKAMDRLRDKLVGVWNKLFN